LWRDWTYQSNESGAVVMNKKTDVNSCLTVRKSAIPGMVAIELKDPLYREADGAMYLTREELEKCLQKLDEPDAIELSTWYGEVTFTNGNDHPERHLVMKYKDNFTDVQTVQGACMNEGEVQKLSDFLNTWLGK
jgi:hypothetical protein